MDFAVSTSPADPLRLRNCPECDYSLETLPPEGRCPECGRAYDQTFIVLMGRGRGRFEQLSGATYGTVLGWIISIGACVLVFRKGESSLQDPFVWTFGSMFLVSGAAQLYGRFFSDQTPQMQLWLTDVGFAQIASTPEARRANFVARHAWACMFPLLLVAPLFKRSARTSTHKEWLIGIAVLITCIPLLHVLRLLWRELSWERSHQAPPVVPWREVSRVKIDDIDSTRTRFRLWRMSRWGSIDVQQMQAVDIELSMERELAKKAKDYVYGHAPM